MKWLLLCLILFGCGGDNGTEPDSKVRYPVAGVWAGWSDLTAFSETEPLARVRTKIDLDLDRLLWGDDWHEMEWEIQLYGTPAGSEGGALRLSWGGCSGGGTLEGVELVVYAQCANSGYNIEFRGTAE